MHCPSNNAAAAPRCTPSGMTCLLIMVCAVVLVCACSDFGHPISRKQDVLNSCQVDAECRADQRCQNKQCVVRTAMAEQTILLQIAPEYAPDGADALPLYTELSRIDGTTNRDIVLPAFTPVTFRLRLDGEPVPGELRVTTVNTVTGLSTPWHSVTAPNALDESMSLTSGATMRVQAIPQDTTFPPLEKLIEVGEAQVVTFDLDSEHPFTQFKFSGLPTAATFIAVAKSPESGRRVSSIATVQDDAVSLRLAPNQSAFVLELKHMPNQPATEPNCENDEEQIPSFQVLIDVEQQPTPDEVLIHIPQTMPTIHYGGSVELCEATRSTPEVLENLTVNLRSSELLQDLAATTTPMVATPYFQQDLQTKFSSDSGLFEFCGPAIPGQYEIVVNAPAALGTCITDNGKLSCGCGIFAEGRLIDAPPESTVQFGAILPLPSLASIFGTLRNVDGKAVAGATVEAVALGLADGIELGINDRGLTAFNRSRQTTSDSDGSFRIPLDVGSYDVTIKPSAESGFAWTVMRDLRIANRSEEFSQDFNAISPVTVSGNLRYLDGNDADNETLVGTVIRAYAVVDDEARPGKKRAIEIAQTMALESGAFVLRIPPTIRDGWL